jgi:predicted DNA-binding transcriptional regulator AlpA
MERIMDKLYIPSENDLKRWVKEAVQEYFQHTLPQKPSGTEEDLVFLNRKEVAKLLQVSLVTLTDWMKRGLPFHKQRGRVYFFKTEVLEYIQKNSPSKASLLSCRNEF